LRRARSWRARITSKKYRSSVTNLMLPPAYDVTCDGTVVPELANPSSEPSGQPIIGQPMVEARAAHA
jgi:hypothetical protein